MLSQLPPLDETPVVFLSDVLSRLGEQGKGQIINRIESSLLIDYAGLSEAMQHFVNWALNVTRFN